MIQHDLKRSFRRRVPNAETFDLDVATGNTTHTDEKIDADVRHGDGDGKRIPDASSNYQAGVRNIEAVTTVWKFQDMVAAYVM